jgi:hypothetical protein
MVPHLPAHKRDLIEGLVQQGPLPPILELRRLGGACRRFGLSTVRWMSTLSSAMVSSTIAGVWNSSKPKEHRSLCAPPRRQPSAWR